MYKQETEHETVRGESCKTSYSLTAPSYFYKHQSCLLMVDQIWGWQPFSINRPSVWHITLSEPKTPFFSLIQPKDNFLVQFVSAWIITSIKSHVCLKDYWRLRRCFVIFNYQYITVFYEYGITDEFNSRGFSNIRLFID